MTIPPLSLVSRLALDRVLDLLAVPAVQSALTTLDADEPCRNPLADIPSSISTADEHARRREHETCDAWGFSLEESRFYYALGYWIFRYFRPEVTGIEHLPRGRVLVVPNHSGQLAFDGLSVAVACLIHGAPPRLIRPMIERWVPALPFVNIALSRAGAVLGDPTNCRNLLEKENAILVFPEGSRGSGKTWGRRYQLAPFGRGFMRLALQTNTPIVPVSIIGAEESIVSIYNAKGLAGKLGMPYLPIPLLLPLLGPFAFFPLPVRFHIHFGEAMTFDGPFDDEDAAIDQKVAEVAQRIRWMIDAGLRQRRSLFS